MPPAAGLLLPSRSLDEGLLQRSADPLPRTQRSERFERETQPRFRDALHERPNPTSRSETPQPDRKPQVDEVDDSASDISQNAEAAGATVVVPTPAQPQPQQNNTDVIPQIAEHLAEPTPLLSLSVETNSEDEARQLLAELAHLPLFPEPQDVAQGTAQQVTALESLPTPAEINDINPEAVPKIPENLRPSKHSTPRSLDPSLPETPVSAPDVSPTDHNALLAMAQLAAAPGEATSTKQPQTSATISAAAQAAPRVSTPEFQPGEQQADQGDDALPAHLLAALSGTEESGKGSERIINFAEALKGLSDKAPNAAPAPAINQPSAEPPSVPDRLLARQVGRAILAELPDGQRSLTVRLTPPELGTVHVQIMEHAGRFTLKLGAEDESVRQALERALPTLRADFRSADAPVSNVQLSNSSYFDLAQQGRQGQASERQGRRGNRQGFAPQAGQLDPNGTTPTRSLGGRSDASGVDARA